jgi:flavin-dependent dehydrogenase
VRKHWPLGVIPVGNAAAALEPIGGEGMGLAMRSAELAATSLLSGRAAEPASDAATLRRDYVRLWRRRRFGCRAAAVAASREAVAGTLLRHPLPDLATRAALRLMGK